MSRGQNIIPIEDEIKHAQNYMNIQKVRYKDKFEVSFKIDPQICSCDTVKLVMQPILENAIYHAVEPLDGEGVIDVVGERTEGDIYIRVTDNGLGMSQEAVDKLLTGDIVRVRKRQNMSKRRSGKIAVLVLVALLVTILAAASYLALFARQKPEKKKVTVILNNSMEEYWVVVKEGMMQAAADYDINLNIVLTDQMESAQEEISILEREIENGAQGIIFEPICENRMAEYLEEKSRFATFTLIYSDINPKSTYACVSPDHYEIGERLAKAILRDRTDGNEKVRIGVLMNNPEQLSRKEMLQGLKAALGSAGEVVWSPNWS